MKRLTALVLAGVLVFGTSCGGGNQTNSGEGQAGAAEQEQTADGADVTEDDAEVTADGATDSSADYADGEQGDAIITEDENAFSGDGTVTAFICTQRMAGKASAERSSVTNSMKWMRSISLMPALARDWN